MEKELTTILEAEHHEHLAPEKSLLSDTSAEDDTSLHRSQGFSKNSGLTPSL